jgi:hypothetical protein
MNLARATPGWREVRPIGFDLGDLRRLRSGLALRRSPGQALSEVHEHRVET